MSLLSRFVLGAIGIGSWFVVNWIGNKMGSSLVPNIVMTVFMGFLSGFLLKRPGSAFVVNWHVLTQAVILIIYAILVRAPFFPATLIILLSTGIVGIQIHFGRWCGSFAQSRFRDKRHRDAPTPDE